MSVVDSAEPVAVDVIRGVGRTDQISSASEASIHLVVQVRYLLLSRYELPCRRTRYVAFLVIPS